MVWAGPVMAQPKWLAMARPFVFEKKIQNFSKIILKNRDFLKYFSIYFA